MRELKVKSEIFEAEMLPYMALLRNYALGLTHDTDDADDLIQETYTRAYVYYDRYTRGTNARAWLFRIMKNLCINHFKERSQEIRRTRFDFMEQLYTGFEDCLGATSDFQDELIGNSFDDEIEQALCSIPADFRTVIILSDIEDYDYEEIASFVGIPIGTVRSRLHRGRRIMRSLLMEYASNRGYGSAAV